jgi:alkylation response protein AidB-like acyl-CoA dehydrogenase
VPAGQGDPFVLALFAWALLGFASVYCGVAKRAIDLVLPGLKDKSSLGLGRSMAYHPEIQHSIGQMVLANESIAPYLERTCADWSEGVDHGEAWPSKIVDLAMDASGGTGMFRGTELERLFRDARCGRFHPANANLTHEIVAKTALGIDLGEQPRWG